LPGWTVLDKHQLTAFDYWRGLGIYYMTMYIYG
jgi:hypothetical protein